MSNSKNDDAGVFIAGLVGVALVCFVIFWAIIYFINSVAFLTSGAGFWIGKIGEWPMTLLRLIGIPLHNLSKYFAISQALGWFIFFGLIGSFSSIIITHALLPSSVPKKKYDEKIVKKYLTIEIAIYLFLSVSFILILWKY